MTRSLLRCAHTACTNAPCIPGMVLDNERVSGTPGLRFRTIADMTAPAWHGWKDTANAVGLHGPPGFKSPILRSSQALSRNRQGQGLTHEAAKGCNSGRSCAHTWPHSASHGRARPSPQLTSQRQT
jgi:hypothetical protein